MFIKPAHVNIRVRDPRTKLHIPAEGVQVPDDDSYWVRRLRSGDVVLVEVKPAPTKAKE